MKPTRPALLALTLLILPTLSTADPIPSGLAFEPWFAQREVTVEIARQSEGEPWIRGTAELPASVDQIAGVVADYKRYGEIFRPALETADVLESSDGGARMHVSWPYPFPFRDRDAIVLYRRSDLGGGGVRFTWENDHRAGDPSAGKRIEDVAGETRLEPLGEGKTRVVYTFLGDLGGNFPKKVEDKAHRAEPVAYVAALRRALGIPHPEE